MLYSRQLSKPMSFLDHLNEQQQQAAKTLHGPLLIIAGAGSGKTRALTYRIANMIAQGVAQPYEILAVTFTNKAAEEMKHRIQNLLENIEIDLNRNSMPKMGTFHSICVQILRRHFEQFGREKSFVIYDSIDQKNLIKRILKEQKIKDDRIKPPLVSKVISGAKNKLQSPEELLAGAVGPVQKEIAEIYNIYEKQLKLSNALDFDDLLLYTVKLFEQFPEILDQYQERWKFINIDEYQDTNHVQYRLVNLLAAKYRNLCVIGDSDQSIYAFRGADIQNILNFEQDYPDAQLIKLEQNYRSTQNILDAADAIIEKNTQRKSKKMWTDSSQGDLIDIWHLESDQQEAQKVIQEVEKLKRKEVSLKDVVILYRTNAQSRMIEEALLSYGIPYKVIGGIKFYARKEIKDILAYLRFIANPNDTDALLRIINTPSRKIGLTTINKLQAFALERSLRLAEVLKHAEMVSSVNQSTKSKLIQFQSSIENWKEMSQKEPLSSLIRQIILDINYEKYLKDGTDQGNMRYDNVLELLSVATKYDQVNPSEALNLFLEEVALVAETDSIDKNQEAITLMTLHSAKGLEYSYVFVIGCEDNLFPGKQALFKPEEMEEERRLMYVGVTRAMKKLYLTAAKKRLIFGDLQFNPLSRFVQDIPLDLTQSLGVDRISKPISLSPFHQKKEITIPPRPKRTFKDGDKVSHPKYGEGIVIEQRERLVTIAFLDKTTGIKKFITDVAPIRKI